MQREDVAFFYAKILHDGKPDALNESAFDLSLVSDRIDHRPDVVHREYLLQSHPASVRIHLDFGHLSAERRDAGIGIFSLTGGVEAVNLREIVRLSSVHQASDRRREGQPLFRSNAADCELAPSKTHPYYFDTKQCSKTLTKCLFEITRSKKHRHSHGMADRACSRAPTAVGHVVGGSCLYLHDVESNPQFLGGNLAQNCMRAAPLLGHADADPHATRTLDHEIRPRGTLPRTLLHHGDATPDPGWFLFSPSGNPYSAP